MGSQWSLTSLMPRAQKEYAAVLDACGQEAVAAKGEEKKWTNFPFKRLLLVLKFL
jgi:hypothetical protein